VLTLLLLQTVLLVLKQLGLPLLSVLMALTVQMVQTALTQLYLVQPEQMALTAVTAQMVTVHTRLQLQTVLLVQRLSGLPLWLATQDRKAHRATQQHGLD
jgi:hypothetical protein